MLSAPIDLRQQYAGLEWTHAKLPVQGEHWYDPLTAPSNQHRDPAEAPFEQVRAYVASKAWIWPHERVCFLCDQHADADALLVSLMATGGVRRTGLRDSDFELTEAGTRSLFIIGGDCFDKGPSNLRLLRVLGTLRAKGARVQILAGNHDLRTLLGIAFMGRREPRFAHLLVRMGKKTIRLLSEVFHEYVRPNPPATYATDHDVKRRLFPGKEWYRDFPGSVEGLVPAARITKELKRIAEKVEELQAQCAAEGLTLGMLESSIRACQTLFLEPDGEFAWYFESMNLAYQVGSFLFVHAGVDDEVAKLLATHGVNGLNRRFRRLLRSDLFELYHGCIGNVFRTKYRDIDFPLTDEGRTALRRAGVYAIVHGHRNGLRGARLTLRGGILNFECDASVDCNTRLTEGLNGPGGATLVFDPAGQALAISTDYPFVRVFDRQRLLPFCCTARGEAC